MNVKVPRKYLQWQTIYRFGVEDGCEGKPSVKDAWHPEAAKAYVAGYKAGENSPQKNFTSSP